MEKIVYILVRLASVTYILYSLWLFLFRKDGLWFLKYLNPKKKKKRAVEKPVQPNTDNDNSSIVGRTHTVYLKPVELPEESGGVDAEQDAKVDAEPEPVMSQDLEPTGFMGEEEDIPSDDVEVENKQFTIDEVLDEEERFELFEGDFAEDENFSTGSTFEDIQNAVDVIIGKKKGGEERLNAAKTIYEIRQTDMMEFFSTQIGNIEVIEQLLSENLDESGQPLKGKSAKKKLQDEVANFDMDKYI